MTRVLALGALVSLVLGVGGAGAEPAARQKCLAQIVFEGSPYIFVRSDGVVRGPRVGRGVKPGCDDTPSGPQPPDVPIPVFKYGSAPSRVALTTFESRTTRLFAVYGRCWGFGAQMAYLRCLQTELRFGGRGYTALRGVQLPPGRAIGRGSLARRLTPVVALQGIDQRIALARRGKPEVWVAHRRCEFAPPDRWFGRCLRAPLWLSVQGSDAIRTATIDNPGSLLRSVTLRLFLAPDESADRITSATDERLAPAGNLPIDAQGRGTAKVAIIASIDAGSYAVMAELPSRRVVPVGALYLAPRRD